MKNVLALAALMLLIPSVASAQVAPSVAPATFDVGPGGEITHWLMLGYFPLEVHQDSYAKVLDVDLLSGQGGEAKLQPVGGQKVMLAASPVVRAATELTWRLARTWKPLVLTDISKFQGLSLFDDDKGNPLEKTGCYLYCQLVSPEDTTVMFWCGSDDSERVMLNGQPIHRFVGQRSASPWEDKLPLALHKGVNHLLVRVDNYVGNGGFYGRLADANGEPIRTVKVQLVLPPGTPEAPTDRNPVETWDKVVAKIPPVKPAEHEEFFGAHLARTMALLESGGQTGRPVRIVFYGQSIEFGWVDMVVQRLRERYPKTEIIAENHALGGWGVYLLVRAMRHDIVRARPDLVFFHAYAGTADEWERVFQTLRKETCADIITRTAHINQPNDLQPLETSEMHMLRPLAQKYNVELVDVRREWIQYLQENKIQIPDLLSDAIHLNSKGCSLMAQLYERHLRINTLYPTPWPSTVRFYSVLRPLDERRYDEITLQGTGWSRVPQGAQARGAGNQLKLKFTGTRLDLVLLADNGAAKVLIDGKAPSQLGLIHGVRPLPRDLKAAAPPAYITQYYVDPSSPLETWELTYRDINADGTKFGFSLRGSVTGEDGQGVSTESFVSKSGRIRIDPRDWNGSYRYPGPAKGATGPTAYWRIVPDYLDRVQSPSRPADLKGQQDYFSYITVADGLTAGEHELTLIPEESGTFSIHGIEACNPPLSGR